MSDNFSILLKEGMVRKGIKAYRIWKDTGISQTSIANYLAGKYHDPDKTSTLLGYLGIKEDQILSTSIQMSEAVPESIISYKRKPTLKQCMERIEVLETKYNNMHSELMNIRGHMSEHFREEVKEKKQ